MKRLSLVISILFFSLLTLQAQTTVDTLYKESDRVLTIRLNNRAFGLGFGRQTHHVSYLSPLLYSGKDYEFWFENIKPHVIKNNLFYSVVNNRVSVSVMTPTNESFYLDSYYDVFEYHYYYDKRIINNFHILCGAYAGFEGGTDMMLSNSNNPVYVRVEFNLLGLSFRPTLQFQTKRRIIKLSDQFAFRLAGINFSPTYTQLYYDLTLKDYDKSEFFDFNSLSEKVRFANKLMAEIPLKKMTLRVGMLAERSKSMINMIDNRTTNVQVLFGFSYDYIHFSGRINKMKSQEFLNTKPDFKIEIE